MRYPKNLLKVNELHYIFCLLALLLMNVFTSFGQSKHTPPSTVQLRKVQRQYGLNPATPLLSRITATPDDIIQQFHEAGMSPTAHQLTKGEFKMIAAAFATLPPLHQQVMQQHLKSISFLDNMPNTALTSPVTKQEGINLYHITFRAGILHQTISEWVTQKERTCFAAGDSTISVSIQAGMLSALTYIMLHEGTHVVDGSLQLISVDTATGHPQPNAFTKSFVQGIWKDITAFSWPFPDSIAIKSRFRYGGRLYLPAAAAEVYTALGQTPFVSLYSTASWHEDLAELLTIYHLTHILKQPFRLVVQQNGKEVFSYEPMQSALVQQRTVLLKRFYDKPVTSSSKIK